MTVTLLQQHRGAAYGPRIHRVRCVRYGKRHAPPRCGFSSLRTDANLTGSCPRCGSDIEVLT